MPIIQSEQPAGETATATATEAPVATATEAPVATATEAPVATATEAPGGVPAAAQCYFDAVHAQQLDAVVACFTPDAVIIDVSRRIVGSEAIRRWTDNEVLGGRYTVIESVPQGQSYRLLVEFVPPGASSGFRAYYTMDFRDGLIVQADLQYA